MQQPKVREIPANLFLNDGRKRLKKLRVAAYCRVSTEEEEQQHSFETQVAYYTEKIATHPDWTLAGVFADDGISGVRAKKRNQFLEMIDLCRRKKIDLIITKSISRFARNTLDCIKYVRELKELGVSIQFEKEGINTATMNTEMILTVLGAFAQAESESISQNVTWGKRKGFKQGKFSFAYKNFLGYCKGDDGKPQIVPEEADVIRNIYNAYLDGDSLDVVKQRLETSGVLSPAGKTVWSKETIQRILQNEKYMGDVLLQKTYTADFLSGTIKKNNGELAQYYITDSHPGIVSKEVFHRVQEEIARRKSKRPATQKKVKTNTGRYTSRYALSERLVCAECGCYYRRVTWSVHGRKEIVWRCINRLEFGKKYCPHSPTIKEEALHAAIVAAMRQAATMPQHELESVLQSALGQSDTAPQTLIADPLLLQNKIAEKNAEFDRLLGLSAQTVDESEFLDRRIKQVNDEILQLKQMKKQAELTAIKTHQSKSNASILENIDSGLSEYNDTLTARTIERITVKQDGCLTLQFVDGRSIILQIKK
ncbi:MAG: recombinase family protein [Ruthenibacterium sp.]